MAELSNPRHEKFCLLYVKNGNATRSYINSGYKESKAAEVCAHRLLRKDKIKQRISEIQQTVSNKLTFGIKEVLQELGHIAFFDPRDVVETFNEHGVVTKSSDEIPDRAWRGMGMPSEKHQGEGVVCLEMKHWNKTDALKALLAFFKDKENPDDPNSPNVPQTMLMLTPTDLKGKGAQNVSQLYQNLLGKKR